MVLIHKRRMKGHYTCFEHLGEVLLYEKHSIAGSGITKSLSGAFSGLAMISIKILARAPVFINFTCHRKIYLGRGYILLITRKMPMDLYTDSS